MVKNKNIHKYEEMYAMSKQEISKIISERISYYLEKNGKTQLQLADYMNVSQATVSNWCKGLKMPRMDKIDKLCAFFSCSRSDLIEKPKDIPMYYESDETREIAQEIFEKPELRSLFDVAKDIPPERLKAHIEFMKSLKDSEK